PLSSTGISGPVYSPARRCLGNKTAMIRTSARLLLGLFALAGAAHAQQVVITNSTGGSCTFQPTGSSIFTLDPAGNIPIPADLQGTGTCGSTGSGGGGTTPSPTFGYSNPAPSDLFIYDANNNKITSPIATSASGEIVTPKFTAYFATSCTGTLSVSP